MQLNITKYNNLFDVRAIDTSSESQQAIERFLELESDS